MDRIKVSLPVELFLFLDLDFILLRTVRRLNLVVTLGGRCKLEDATFT